jgi:hypothetical protein
VPGTQRDPPRNRFGGGAKSTEAQWYIGRAQTRRFCADRELGGLLKALYFLIFCDHYESERMLHRHGPVGFPLRFRRRGPACSVLHAMARRGSDSAAHTI